ncbi:MAG: thioredoxin, partial [Prevotellaceae bacterium]|nr:thioredoxin [Prevotellaceae bacterium]
KTALSIIFLSIFAISSAQQQQTENQAIADEQTESDYGKVTFLTFESFKQKVVALQPGQNEWNYIGDKPCLIDFYASWCGPCRILSPHLDALAKELAGKIYIYKIDTQREKELAQIFNITSIPALLFCPVGKKPVMLRGYRDKAALEKEINQYLLVK